MQSHFHSCISLQSEEERSAEVRRVASEGERRLQELDAQVQQYKAEVSKCQAEVDRLLLILKQSKTEKQELEATAAKLREQLKESQHKMIANEKKQAEEILQTKSDLGEESTQMKVSLLL
jgi:F0F1-type ATP synthase membrane subunit b/b'